MLTLAELDALIETLQKSILDAEAMKAAKKVGDHYNEGFYCGWLWHDMAMANSVMDTAKKRENDNA